MASQQNTQKTDGFIEKLVSISRHSKVVKGGRIFSFSAMVVVGDGVNRIGIGRGKAREVSIAIQKAMDDARHNLVRVNLNDDTIWYPVTARYSASKVYMQPASQGTGIIAGGPMRAVFEVLGVHNVLSKVYGSTNPVNVVKATLKGLLNTQNPEYYASKRGKTIQEIKE